MGKQCVARKKAGEQCSADAQSGKSLCPTGPYSIWKLKADGVVEAYALRALKISPERLESVTRGLYTLAEEHEIVEISVIKYWYDPSWPEPDHSYDLDLALAEFSFHLSLEFRRRDETKLVSRRGHDDGPMLRT